MSCKSGSGSHIYNLLTQVVVRGEEVQISLREEAKKVEEEVVD